MTEQHRPAGQASALAGHDDPGAPQAQSGTGTEPGTADGRPQPETPTASQPGTVAPEPGAATGQPRPGIPATGQPVAAPASPRRHHVLRRTRTGGVWVAMGASAVVLLLLLIFILENQRQVDIGFFGAHASLPIGVAMLLAAVGGALIVIIPGTGRIIQLRLTARRHRRKDTAAAQLPPATGQAPAAPGQAPAAPGQAPAAPEPQRPPASPDPLP
jgi:uncharacterized integral membrane protein